MIHDHARDAATAYLVGLYTFRELDEAAARSGLRNVRLRLDGSVTAEGGHGINRYTLTLAN